MGGAEHPEAERGLAARFRARVEEAAQAGWAGRREGAGVDRRQAAAALLHPAIGAFIYLEQGKPKALGFLKDGHHVL